jgi:hypothetical protein
MLARGLDTPSGVQTHRRGRTSVDEGVQHGVQHAPVTEPGVDPLRLSRATGCGRVMAISSFLAMAASRPEPYPGTVPTAATRVLAHASIHDDLLNALVKASRSPDMRAEGARGRPRCWATEQRHPTRPGPGTPEATSQPRHPSYGRPPRRRYRLLSRSHRHLRTWPTATVWSTNHSRILRTAPELDFGCVWINTHGPLTPEMPHGGFKHSEGGS